MFSPVELTRFRGHPIDWAERKVHDAEEHVKRSSSSRVGIQSGPAAAGEARTMASSSA
jgi:hypothetical protein